MGGHQGPARTLAWEWLCERRDLCEGLKGGYGLYDGGLRGCSLCGWLWCGGKGFFCVVLCSG